MISRQISIAPMMAYTDRHYRVLMRLMTRRALMYTEMVATGSLIHGKKYQQLHFSPVERPLALQLGGSNPEELAICSRMAQEFEYDEVNLNVGCPSDRVHCGQFGACLMKKPGLVAECLSAMQEAVSIPVTIKTRIGVDHDDSYESLQHFIATIQAAGCRTFIIHARKAWLKGLSPRQNRTLPPLRYETVYQLKKDFPELEIIINGGIKTQAEIKAHLQQVDGVMIGREAYDNPFLLAESSELSPRQVVLDYLPYLARELDLGTPLWKMSRHLMGLFKGHEGARQWRCLLTGWREGPDKFHDLRDAMENFLAKIKNA